MKIDKRTMDFCLDYLGRINSVPFFLQSSDHSNQLIRDCEEELNVLIGITKS